MWKRAALYFCYGVTILSVLSCIVMLDRAVTAMAEDREETGGICIILDPGHGGEDGGAISVSGKPESFYNLEIATRLRDLLQLLGYRTIMTRDTDISIYTKGKTLAQKKSSDLQQRVKKINEIDNALLLSIHQNSFPDERYSGPQVFYAGTNGSEELARQLQDIFTEVLQPETIRLAKRSSGVYLMEHIQRTGVLIECGFLSNYKEEALLRNTEYQKKLSVMIAGGVSQYLSNT